MEMENQSNNNQQSTNQQPINHLLKMNQSISSQLAVIYSPGHDIFFDTIHDILSALECFNLSLRLIIVFCYLGQQVRILMLL